MNMTTSMIISTIIECAVGIFLIWGIFNEDKLCDFEEALWENIKAYIGKKKPEKREVQPQCREA